MIEASSRNTFRTTFQVAADPEQGVPAGRIEVSSFVAPDLSRARVDAVYVALPEHGSQVARSKSFDDGAVVLDLDAQGRPTGVELTTTRKGILELTEFCRHARTDRVSNVLVVTALGVARQLEVALAGGVALMRDVAAQAAEQGLTFKVDQVRVTQALFRQTQESTKPRWETLARSA